MVELRITSLAMLLKQQPANCAAQNGVFFHRLSTSNEAPPPPPAHPQIIFDQRVLYKHYATRESSFKEAFAKLCGEIGVEAEEISIWKISFHADTSLERIENATNLSSTVEDLKLTVFLMVPLDDSMKQEKFFKRSTATSQPLIIAPYTKVSNSDGGNSNEKEKVWERYFHALENKMMLVFIKLTVDATQSADAAKITDCLIVSKSAKFVDFFKQVQTNVLTSKSYLLSQQNFVFREVDYSH